MEETKTIAPDKLLMEQLNNRDWNKFWVRLMGRSAWLLRKRYTVKWPNDQLISFSRTAISEVINKIFITKDREWNLDAYPDFEDFIVGALDSHINNTLNKTKKEIDVGDSPILERNGESAISASDIIIGQELRKEISDELQAAGADDYELLVFECLADGIEKPEAIKKELKLSDEDFHNIWRRFKRKRKVIQNKLATYGH